MLEEIFFFSFESKKFEISKTIVTKNMWIELNVKNYFNEKNKISKKSKSKPQSLNFFQKRNEKIENFDKNSVTLVYLDFSFFNFRSHMINN